MSWTATGDAVSQYFVSNWTATDILFDVSSQDPPQGEAYIHLRISPVLDQPIDFGSTSTTYETTGLISVSVYVPDAGVTAAPQRLARDLAGQVTSLLRSYSYGSMRVEDVSIQDAGKRNDDRWQYLVTGRYREEARETMKPTESTQAVTYTQASHGLAVGDAVRISSGSWVKAQADTPTTPALGVVSYVSGDVFAVQTGGFASLALGLGSSGSLYLSQGTAGLLTTTAPSSGVIQQIGSILSSAQILINIGPVQVL